ncbi:hypothetical protein FGG08_006937 [Glutinoglossum americanum]|uniref:Uncharacterized protein n=1 Tax=Glutinoglossum americanum TaxID=1670608 RepID=A0A9P8HZV2_9PEZI|nr:hypothetical protein FGG08_006937 [Glutinoglossum americanum]
MELEILMGTLSSRERNRLGTKLKWVLDKRRIQEMLERLNSHKLTAAGGRTTQSRIRNDADIQAVFTSDTNVLARVVRSELQNILILTLNSSFGEHHFRYGEQARKLQNAIDKVAMDILCVSQRDGSGKLAETHDGRFME